MNNLTPVSVGQPIFRWAWIVRVLFRFIFSYFLLYAFFGGNGSPLGLLPGIGGAIDCWIQRPMDLLAQGVGLHLFHLTGRAASIHLQATGDGALRWVAVAVMLAAAVLATMVWSVLDRRRENYITLLGWFRFVMRLVLGVALLKYGFIKVFPVQFGTPPLALLNEPVGNSSATLLFWSVYGLNPAFVMTLGWTEVVAGLLLLFRRTAFAGALLALAIMTNVALLDISFDVPVKLYSLSLVAMAFVLLAPELGLFLRLFLTQRPVTASKTWGPNLSRQSGRRALFSVELLIAVLGCWQLSTGTWSVWRLKAAAMRDPPPITGEWAIDGSASGIVGGNDSPIVTLYFEPNSDAMLRAADGSLWRSRAVYERDHQRLRLLYDVTGVLLFAVDQPDPDHLILTPEGPAAAQLHRLSMTRVVLPKSYPLLQREFHWVNDFEPLR